MVRKRSLSSRHIKSLYSFLFSAKYGIGPHQKTIQQPNVCQKRRKEKDRAGTLLLDSAAPIFDQAATISQPRAGQDGERRITRPVTVCITTLHFSNSNRSKQALYVSSTRIVAEPSGLGFY